MEHGSIAGDNEFSRRHCFLLVVVSPHALAGSRKRLVGDWRPINDINDPEVQMGGKFAVSEYNKEFNVSLEFLVVEKGETQVVSGLKYKLDVAVEEGGAKKNYEAVVLVKAWENFKKLMSFEPIKG